MQKSLKCLLRSEYGISFSGILKFPDKKYLYISNNPKKDFFAPKKLNWFTIRFKNPYGIYKDVENNTDIEVYSREEILKYLSETTKNVL